MNTVSFQLAVATESPALDLIRAMTEEMVGRYRRAPLGPEIERELVAPHGGYLVGWAGDQPVAGGGIRQLGDGLGEVKRMYVVPAWRGQGVARQLLAALERLAVDLGYTRLRLDTGPEQPDAEHLYRSTGYIPIDNYSGSTVATFFGEKRLAGA